MANPSTARTVLGAIGDGIVSWRRSVVIGSLAMAVALGLGVFDLTVGFRVAGFFESDDPELQAAVEHYRDGGFERPDNLLLFAWREPEPLSVQSLGRVERFSAVLAAQDIVLEVLSVTTARLPGVLRPDAAATAASSTFRDLFVARSNDAVGGIATLRRWQPSEMRELVDELRSHAAVAGIDLQLCGLPYHTLEAARLVKSDMATFLPLGTAVSAVFLFWLVPHVALAFLALLVVPLVLMSTLGTMAMCGVEVTMLTSTLPTLLLCMSIADGVHMVGRFGEERRSGHEPKVAAARTFAAMFMPCLMTSLTTIVGFLSLMRADLQDLRQLGVFAAVGMGYAFFYTVTILPAAMSWVGAVPRERRRDPGAWILVMARAALRLRPLLWVAIALAVLVGGGLSATRLDVDHRVTGDLWPQSDTMRQLRFYEEHFVGVMPAELLVEHRDGFGSAAAVADLAAFRDRIEQLPDVSRTLSIADLAADGMAPMVLRGLASLRALPASLLDREGSIARVVTFRGDFGTKVYRRFVDTVGRLAAGFPALTVRVVGAQRIGTEQVVRMTRDLATSFFGSIAVIFVLVWLSCRRVPLALVAVATCLVPLVSVLGGMPLFGATLRPLTVIAFCIALGLMIDDAIHLIARWQEERRRGKDGDQAVSNMLVTAGRPVVTTTVLLLVGFSTILYSEFRGTFSFGLLVLSSLIGSLVAALLLLPALLRVFGRNVRLRSRDTT